MKRLLAVGLVVLGAAATTRAQAPEYRVIVNAANPVDKLSTEQLTEFFLDRASRWPHGPEVAAVDQSAQSAIREVFTRRVMGKTVDSVVSYWRQQMMSVRETPPPVKRSDADVIRYVEKNKDAVGYVTPEATLPPTVKALTIQD